MYERSKDALDRWLDERCRQTTNGFETSADLYASWKAWAGAAGEFVGSQKRFSQGLSARNFEKWREPGTGRRGFRGLTLNDPARNSSPEEAY